jgi:hypothetical protein
MYVHLKNFEENLYDWLENQLGIPNIRVCIYSGEWKCSSSILDLGTSRRWVVSFMPRYPLDRRLGGSHSLSGRCEEENNFVQPVRLIMLTGLSRHFPVVLNIYILRFVDIISSFSPVDFLRKLCQICLSDYPVFTFYDFATIIFFQSNVVNLASNPKHGEHGPCIYVPQWQGGQSIPLGHNKRAWIFILSTRFRIREDKTVGF